MGHSNHIAAKKNYLFFSLIFCLLTFFLNTNILLNDAKGKELSKGAEKNLAKQISELLRKGHRFYTLKGRKIHIIWATEYQRLPLISEKELIFFNDESILKKPFRPDLNNLLGLILIALKKHYIVYAKHDTTMYVLEDDYFKPIYISDNFQEYTDNTCLALTKRIFYHSNCFRKLYQRRYLNYPFSIRQWEILPNLFHNEYFLNRKDRDDWRYFVDYNFSTSYYKSSIQEKTGYSKYDTDKSLQWQITLGSQLTAKYLDETKWRLWPSITVGQVDSKDFNFPLEYKLEVDGVFTSYPRADHYLGLTSYVQKMSAIGFSATTAKAVRTHFTVGLGPLYRIEFNNPNSIDMALNIKASYIPFGTSTFPEYSQSVGITGYRYAVSFTSDFFKNQYIITKFLMITNIFAKASYEGSQLKGDFTLDESKITLTLGIKF